MTIFDNMLYMLLIINAFNKTKTSSMGIGQHFSLSEVRYSLGMLMLKNVPSKLNRYVINKELQHTDNFIFCVTPFDFWCVLDKAS